MYHKTKITASATAELDQMTVVFRTIYTFIRLMYHIKIYWSHEAKIQWGWGQCLSRPRMRPRPPNLASRSYWPQASNLIQMRSPIIFISLGKKINKHVDRQRGEMLTTAAIWLWTRYHDTGAIVPHTCTNEVDICQWQAYLQSPPSCQI